MTFTNNLKMKHILHLQHLLNSHNTNILRTLFVFQFLKNLFQNLFILLLRNQTKVCLEFILKVVLEDLFSNLGYFTKRGHWDDYGLRTFGLTKQGRGQKEEGENR